MSSNPEFKRQTVNTYNQSALELADYFQSLGSRIVDIELAIEQCGKPNPDVLEIGCGDGRDAKEIIPRVGSYVGIDISEGLLNIAKKYVPEAQFAEADAITFDYGESRYDIIFAFASLLHLDIEEIDAVFKKVHKALRENGIFYISLKRADEYKEEIKEDIYGTRIFYFYNPEIISQLVGWRFDIDDRSRGFVTTGNTQWFEMALKKK